MKTFVLPTKQTVTTKAFHLYHFDIDTQLLSKSTVYSSKSALYPGILFSLIHLGAIFGDVTEWHSVTQPRSQGPLSSSLEGGRERTLGTRLSSRQIE